jgi:hypothetical protein
MEEVAHRVYLLLLVQQILAEVAAVRHLLMLLALLVVLV